jgi:hypothetical protein
MWNMMFFNVAVWTVIIMRITFSNFPHICVPFDSYNKYELFC